MKKILIIDDEQTILLSLKYFFSGNNIMAVTCNDLDCSKNALAFHKFDLVISDIRLSGTNETEGLDLLRDIKKHSPETPVIIMTAYGSAELEKEAYNRGAFHYFEKPIDMTQLTEKISTLGIVL